jgi:hypothetical protein
MHKRRKCNLVPTLFLLGVAALAFWLLLSSPLLYSPAAAKADTGMCTGSNFFIRAQLLTTQQ